jgi:hypothetical protein
VVVASAENGTRAGNAQPRLGDVARHSFQVHIRLGHRGPVDILTLEKHPSLPWQQRGTIPALLA